MTKRNIRKDKKGSAARDAILIIIVVFIFAIGLFTLYFTTDTIIDGMLNVDVINDSSATRTTLNDARDNTIPRLDYIIFSVFIGLVIGLIITSWFIGGNAIFMFIYFIMITIGIVISMVLGNVWEEISTASVFGTTINAFPITNHLLTNAALYMAVVGMIAVVVMFAKPYMESRGL